MIDFFKSLFGANTLGSILSPLLKIEKKLEKFINEKYEDAVKHSEAQAIAEQLKLDAHAAAEKAQKSLAAVRKFFS